MTGLDAASSGDELSDAGSGSVVASGRRRGPVPAGLEHLVGRHTHEWGRFTIRARDVLAAGRLAAVLGWWLHCWRFEEADVPDAVVVEHAPPSPFGSWEEFVACGDERRSSLSWPGD